MTAAPLDTQRIREQIGTFIERERIPGASVGVVRGGELVLAEGFGFADIESQRPQAPELRHRIGSITKTMMGLCLMALVDEGRLALDDRITERLPDVRFTGPYETIASGVAAENGFFLLEEVPAGAVRVWAGQAEWQWSSTERLDSPVALPASIRCKSPISPGFNCHSVSP